MTSVTSKQNVLVRVVNLPLVSSTCVMVSSAYSSTKENHPYLKSACEVAEKGVKSIAAAALANAMPIIQNLEPQIAVANNYACIGLDKMEKLPILYQPTERVVANAIGLVLGVKGTVTQAKDAAAHMITGVVAKTKGAVQESIETTKAAVSSSVNAVLGSHMMQMVSTGVDAALTKSEALVDQYFPLSDEAATKAAILEGLEAGTQEPSYYIRLKSLSSKVHRRAYEKVLNKVNDAITQLHHTIDLTSESRILIGVQDLTRQLRTTCLTLVSRIQDLPQNLQDQIHQIHIMAGNIYQNFNSTTFKSMAEQLCTITKTQLKKIELHVEDYFVSFIYPQLQEYRDEEEEELPELCTCWKDSLTAMVMFYQKYIWL
ncbi:perilipin-2 [Microcaecilia unicolor]|uniref:Perilipin n=1 Tax=Microcaecilia unicolor TaxID=1415580 RepID=A0A6P7X9S5_9AMPH|nr:perilipin-2-like [Microcaecilia unicolor]